MAMSISRKASSVILYNSTLILSFLLCALQNCFASENYTCNKDDHESLLSFYQHISSPPAAPLNWSSYDCCKWEGVGCGENHRVNSLWLPNRDLSGIISPSLGNLSFLSFLNISHNRLSQSLPDGLFRSLSQLEVVDLSYNSLSGDVLEPTEPSGSLPVSIKTLDLSSNHFNGSIDPSLFQGPLNLNVFNVSNNSFTGPVPLTCCQNASLIRVLDLSMNKFTGEIPHGFALCSNLEVFRAGFNVFSGRIPYDLFGQRTLTEISLPSSGLIGPIDYIRMARLSNLTILELHDNQLTGEIPEDIGSLSNLEKLLLHTNNFTGSLPPSLMNCTRLKMILLRNNMLEGDVSALDFSRLQQLQSIDLGQNNFTGNFPASLCLCSSLTAIRLAYNKVEGQLPPCLSQIKSLGHISVSDNYLVNATGALRILMGCKNLTVIFLSRTFNNEMLPDDRDMEDLDGFQNLEILTLAGGKFRGQIPNWISKLKKLKIFSLAVNKITGPVPTWLGSMSNLLIVNFTDNHLLGHLPRELGNLTALSAEEPSDDFGYLALPFVFSAFEYKRLFNMVKGLKFGHNDLSGSIPAEIGRLKQLQILDLSENNVYGSIPVELSDLVNLEDLDLSGNHLTGEIPASLTNLHFLSAFSVANNDLQGEIPHGNQFDTFPASSFEGNPKLCGPVIEKPCHLVVSQPEPIIKEESDSIWSFDSLDSPIWIGFVVGFAGVYITLIFHKSWKHAYFGFLNRLEDKIFCCNSSQYGQIVGQTSSYKTAAAVQRARGEEKIESS